MTLPKGWLRVPGDTVATMIFRSPSAPQDIRIAKTTATRDFTGDAGVQNVRKMVARFPFPQTQVVQTMVCGGTQPAILTTAKNAQGATVMEQIVVMGTVSGAIITYEISDGRPDVEAENAIRSVCIP
jgi:hypothetical protein